MCFMQAVSLQTVNDWPTEKLALPSCCLMTTLGLLLHAATLHRESDVNTQGIGFKVQSLGLDRAQVLVGTTLRSGGLQAANVSYVAVHGTGTPLGDPIEVGALAGALSGGPRHIPLTIDSVKVSLE